MLEHLSEANVSIISENNDPDFELTADMMVHEDMDDERTLAEQEMVEANADFSSEVNDLQKVQYRPFVTLTNL